MKEEGAETWYTDGFEDAGKDEPRSMGTSRSWKR